MIHHKPSRLRPAAWPVAAHISIPQHITEIISFAIAVKCFRNNLLNAIRRNDHPLNRHCQCHQDMVPLYSSDASKIMLSIRDAICQSNIRKHNVAPSGCSFNPSRTPTGNSHNTVSHNANPINALECSLLPQKLRHGAVHAARSKINAIDNCLSTVHHVQKSVRIFPWLEDLISRAAVSGC